MTSSGKRPPPAFAYREHAPSAALAPYVACYWTSTRFAPDGSSVHRVLPDGCSDFLFGLEPASGEGLFVGTMTRPLVRRQPPRERWVAVRFRPGGAHPFVGGSLAELTDQVVTLADLGLRSARLYDGLMATAQPRRQVAALESWLLRRLDRAGAPDPMVAWAVDRIEASSGRVPVGELSDALGVSRQHLARRMRALVGIGPKTLARVHRMQAALELMREPAPVTGIDVALRAGYYDQAHMIGELRSLTGLTPTEIVRR